MVSRAELALAKPMGPPLSIDHANPFKKSLSRQSHTYREVESHMAKDRYIFAASNEQICDKWVATLNFLIYARDKNQQRH